MWPFTKKPQAAAPPIPIEPIFYSQLDITESFGDDSRLAADDWIPTVPLNRDTPDPESAGLPSVNASDGEIYEVAAKLSEIRESVPVPNDGVYCPICHIANTQLPKLHTPCPKCGRALLKFGWD